MRILATLLEALAPRRCAGCGDPAPAALCASCVDVLRSAPTPLIPGVTAAWLHAGTARRVLLRGKYHGRSDAYRLLAALAAERVGPTLLGLGHGGGVVPVPSVPVRRRRRGVDTAGVAAAAIADLVPGVGPLLPHLARGGDRGTRVGAGGAERRRRAPAFTWRAVTAPPTRLLVVDDVHTTGTTLAAAARALQRAGARRIEPVAITASLSTPAQSRRRIGA